MGNLYSTEVKIEFYRWSSAEFRTEYAFIYSSPINSSRFIIFRLSCSQNKVLCRLADFLCDDHPVRIHAEITAERDRFEYFNINSVKAVVEGIPPEFVSLRREGDFNFLGGTGCYCCSPRSAEVFGSSRRRTWEFFHWYGVRFRTRITHQTSIECDKLAGLSAKLIGPVRSEEAIYGEPPKAVNDVVEREFEGREYIMFQQEENGNSRSRAGTFGQGTRVIVNNGGHFGGHGNGSTYNHCKIVMH